MEVRNSDRLRPLNKQVQLFEHNFNEYAKLYKVLNGQSHIGYAHHSTQSKQYHKEILIRLDLHSFINSSHMDLLIVLKQLLKADLAWEQTYSQRNAYLTIYEIIKTYGNKQKEITEIVAASGPQIESELQNILVQLRGFGRKYGLKNRIKNIRNTVSAHIDGDFETFHDMIQKLRVNPNQCYSAVKEFILILDKIDDCIRKIALTFPTNPKNIYFGLNQKMMAIKKIGNTNLQ